MLFFLLTANNLNRLIMSELDRFVIKFNKKLEGSLLSCDLWLTKDYTIVASHNSNKTAVITLGKLVVGLRDSIENLGLPPIKNYQIINLEMNTLLVAIYLDNDHILSCVIDKSKITYGMLFAIIPSLIADFKKINN